MKLFGKILTLLLLLVTWQVTGAATLFADDFNRANGVLGANWDAATDDQHEILGNEARHATSGGSGPALTAVAAHADTADVKVSIKIASTVGTYDGGICVRATFNLDAATGNGYVLDLFGSSAEVYRRIGGANTEIYSQATTLVEGDKWTLEVSGTGATVTLKVYRNDVQLGPTISDTDAARIVVAGRTGLFSWGGDLSAYDDFLVEDLAGGGGGGLKVNPISGRGGAAAQPIAFRSPAANDDYYETLKRVVGE